MRISEPGMKRWFNVNDGLSDSKSSTAQERFCVSYSVNLKDAETWIHLSKEHLRL